MALLGHVTPEMTLRYATLASRRFGSAYDEAMGKVRKRIPVAPAGRPAVPPKVEWIASEFLKTRLGTGYCSRHLAAGPCPYANVCETCDNFAPGTRVRSGADVWQLDDVRELKADAERRGWSERQLGTNGSGKPSSPTFAGWKNSSSTQHHRLSRAHRGR